MPDWFDVVHLADWYRVMPSVILDEPVEWIFRMAEYNYHKSKAGLE